MMFQTGRHLQQPPDLKGSTGETQPGGMGEAAIHVLRRQPGRKRPASDDRAPHLAPVWGGSPEFQRQGPVLVVAVDKCVAAGAGALDSGNQRAAVLGLHGTHHLGQTGGQIIKPGTRTSPQTPLWHRRLKPGRAGPGIRKMRHAQMPGECNVRAVAGPLPSA